MSPLAWLPLVSALLAADVSDTLAGTAGWVGSGLLGAVLAWLLFVHLPNKDKQLKEMLEGRDKIVSDLIHTRDEAVRMLAQQHDTNATELDKSRRADFREALGVIVGHCQRESATLHGMMQHEIGEVTKAVMDLRRSLEELREAYLTLIGPKRSTDDKGVRP